MTSMNRFDYLSLDGRSLRVLVTVAEQGSVSRAADQLGLTQSAVSHTLDKLRAILGDPLFVRAGRGIVATSRAQAACVRARALLDQMKGLTADGDFDPARTEMRITIAANDFQRDLLLPELLRRLVAEAPGIRLRVIPSGVPAVGLLREDHCDLLITPLPPDGPDVIQKRLLTDKLACFFDPSVRCAPGSLREYLGARHLRVAFGPDERNIVDEQLARAGGARDIALTVPNFAGVPPFLQQSDLLATLPSLMRFGLMRAFASAAVPFDIDPLPVYMVWHQRNQHDSAHGWVRAHLEKVAEGTMARISGAPS
jgi:DNA-binding transcriptional LysR family regulator